MLGICIVARRACDVKEYLTAPNKAQLHSFFNASTVSSGRAVPVL